jgi:hypothetical protein
VKDRDYLGDRDVDGRIIFKQIKSIKKQGVRLCTRLFSLSVRVIGGSL